MSFTGSRAQLYPAQHKIYRELSLLLSPFAELTPLGYLKSTILINAARGGLITFITEGTGSILSVKMLRILLTDEGWLRIKELISELLPLVRNQHFWELHGSELIPIMSLEHLPEFLVCEDESLRSLAAKRVQFLRGATVSQPTEGTEDV